MTLGTFVPARRGAPADTTGLRDPLIDAINYSVNNSARTIQRSVGPSEIGTPCTRQLAYKVAESATARDFGDVWPSFLGTAAHRLIAEALELDEKRNPGTWLIELPVQVTPTLRGTMDAFHLPSRTVVDHKVLGDSTHREYSTHGPSEEYRVQAHSYGLGMENAGYTVDRVALALYRRAGRLRDLVVWAEPYDRAIALKAVSRLNDVTMVVSALGNDPVRICQSIPATPGDSCYFCPYKGDQRGMCPGEAAA